MLHFKKTYFVGVILCLCIATTSAYAVTEHTGLWTGFVILGESRFGPDTKYYYDAQLKLIDDAYKFNEIYSSLGIGKRLNANWLFFLVNRFLISKQVSNGQVNYEYRLWQEANWHEKICVIYDLSSRSRLEERKHFSQSQINLRFRQRVMLRKQLLIWPAYSFVIYDEIFLNINRVSWGTNNFVDQNRFFIGVGTNITKIVEADIGYLNKYQFGSAQQITNILGIFFNVTGKSHYYKE